MAISLTDVEGLAPDQGSLSAARKLLKPSGWPLLAEGENLIWGECQGSGATPYRVIVHEGDRGYKCTCPSRKFPCKHSLALMWMRAEGKVAFNSAPRPDWVDDWLSRRRGPQAKPADAEAGAARAAPSIAAAAEEPDAVEKSAEAIARAQAQSARLRAEREAAILEGLEQLDLWATDRLERGLLSFASEAQTQCKAIARRMVDAKAGGLALRIERLGVDLFTIPDALRPSFLMRALGDLHLIAAAYRRQGALDAALVADVRRAVGWSQTRDELLHDPAASSVRGDWVVLATRAETQPDKLRRFETYLALAGGEQTYACLMDFAPVSAGARGSGFVAGEIFSGRVVFYPSAAPSRALLAERAQTQAPPRWRAVFSISEALADYEAAAARLPWLDERPMALRAVQARASGESLWLADDAGAIPLLGGADILALDGAGVMDVFGLWNGALFRPLYADTQIGRWSAP
jgi:hypothetical protein